jgi:hypothetical protein
VAARLRKELDTDVRMVHGHYGEFKVLVGDNVVVDGGKKVILGIMPPYHAVLDAVRRSLGGPTSTAGER